MGTKCLTLDGTWVWPEGFAHSIEAHSVRPPQEFIDHLLSADPKLLVELRLRQTNQEAILTEWRPLQKDTSNCPDKGTACKFELRGDLGFHCEKKVGLGTTGAYSCIWAMDKMRDAFTAERERHAAAIEPFVKNPWKD